MNKKVETSGNRVDLIRLIAKLGQVNESISNARKIKLKALATEILHQVEKQGSSKLIFVCTHNSRRSQLAELWMAVLCSHLHLDVISTYSGGTEATAFNHRMVEALDRFGFKILNTTPSNNPKYSAEWASSQTKTMFSKIYDHEFNPNKDFIAIMVCDQADSDCPFIPGAYSRFSLPYKDPKEFDNTEKEQQEYDRKVIEIGQEILFLCNAIKSEIK